VPRLQTKRSLVNGRLARIAHPEGDRNMELEEVRLLIRQKLQNGHLPDHSMPILFGGPGDGEVCDGCGEPVLRGHLITEGIASTLNDSKPAQFHIKCFHVWDTERARRP